MGVPLLIAGGLWYLIAGTKECLPDGIVVAQQLPTGEPTKVRSPDKRKRTIGTLAWVAAAVALVIVQQTFFQDDAIGESDRAPDVQKERMVVVYPRAGVATVEDYCYGFQERSELLKVKKFRKDFGKIKGFVDESLLTRNTVLLKPGQEVSIQSDMKGVREVLTLDGKRLWVFADWLKPLKRIKKIGS